MTDGQVIDSAGQWRRMRGHLLGLAQPSLHGQLRVLKVSSGLLAHIDAAFETVAGPLPLALVAMQGAAGLAHRVLHWTAALQSLAGLAVSERYHLGPAVAAKHGCTHFDAALPVANADACGKTLAFACQHINRCATNASTGHGLAPATAELLQALRHVVGRGQNTPYLLRAALALDIPVQRITAEISRLGWGRHQRLMASTFTDHTPALGANLSRDKSVSAMLLRQLGMPGAENRAVQNADQAVAAAKQLGYPVVVKPRDLDGGQGVAADLRDEAAVRLAYAAAVALAPKVLVERHVAGTGHRLTVAYGRVVKAAAKRNWGVLGDGRSSIHELVRLDVAERAAKAATPALSLAPALPASTWSLDDEALGMLAQADLTPDSVPLEGQTVTLRRRNNAVAGGSTERLELNAVHPDNLVLAVRAAEAMLLDLAGVDLIVADISQSWATQSALICEVNAQPQTDPKTMATIVGEVMGGGDGRIPVFLLLLGRTAVAPTEPQLVELMTRLQVPDLASATGIWLQGQRVPSLAMDAWSAAGAVLGSRHASKMAVVMRLGEVLQHGLPVDRLVGWAAAPDVPALQALLSEQQVPANAMARGSRYVAPNAPWHADDLVILSQLPQLIGPHLVAGDAQG